MDVAHFEKVRSPHIWYFQTVYPVTIVKTAPWKKELMQKTLKNYSVTVLLL